MKDYVGQIGDIWGSEITLYRERRLWVTNMTMSASPILWLLSNIW